MEPDETLTDEMEQDETSTEEQDESLTIEPDETLTIIKRQASCIGSCTELFKHHGPQWNSGTDMGTTLLLACNTGETEAVKFLFNHGLQDYCTSDGNSALMVACCAGHIEVVQGILDYMYKLDVQKEQPTMQIIKGHTEVVKVLLDHIHGEEVNKQNNGGETALMLACCIGCDKVVKLLLEHNANVNTQSNVGMSALMPACLTGHTEIARLLLSYGAIVDMQDNDGHHALKIACIVGQYEIAQILVHHGTQVNLTDNSKFSLTCLEEASDRGYTEIVKLLIDYGAKINFTRAHSDLPRSALLLASFGGHTDIVSLLLHHGAQAQVQFLGMEISVLLSAICAGHTDVVKILLDQGALQNSGDIPIILSARLAGSNETAKRLYKGILSSRFMKEYLSEFTESDKDELDKIHSTMATSSAKEQFQMVSLLKDHGAKDSWLADILEEILDLELLPEERKDIEDECILLAAIVAGDIETTTNLLDFQESDDAIVSPLFMAILTENPETLKSFFEKSIEHFRTLISLDIALPVFPKLALESDIIDDLIDDLMCSFVTSSVDGHAEVLKTVINRGADVNGLFSDGLSPLIVASLVGHIETVKVLLDHGAQVNMQGSNGLSALIVASFKGNSEIVQCLLLHDAEFNMPDNDGNSALLCASLTGNQYFLQSFSDLSAFTASQKDYINTVKLLLSHGAKDLENNNGQSAQIVASSYGNIDIVKVLLDHGNPVEAAALEIAQNRNHVEVAEMLSNYCSGSVRMSRDSSPDPEFVLSSIKKLLEEYFTEIRKLLEKEIQLPVLEQMVRQMRQIADDTDEIKQLLLSILTQTKSKLFTTNKDLKINTVLKELYPLASEWQNIGLFLEIEVGQLKIIEIDYRMAKDCLREVIREWFKMIDPPPSWENLVEAVEYIDQSKAYDIKMKYCT